MACNGWEWDKRIHQRNTQNLKSWKWFPLQVWDHMSAKAHRQTEYSNWEAFQSKHSFLSSWNACLAHIIFSLQTKGKLSFLFQPSPYFISKDRSSWEISVTGWVRWCLVPDSWSSTVQLLFLPYNYCTNN